MQLKALIAALALAGAGCVEAGAASAGTTEETRVAVRSDGKTEIVRVGEMQVGEVRAIVTEGGTPAVITRTEAGLRLEVNNKIHEVEFTPHAHAGVDGATHFEKRILRGDEEAASLPTDGKRIVKVVKHHGPGHDGEIELDIEARLEEALALAEAEGAEAGKDRVVVVRTVKKVD